MRKVLQILIITFISAAGVTNAQIESATGYISDYKVDSWYELKIDSQVLHRLEGLVQPKDVSYQFAVPVKVNLNPGNAGRVYQNSKEKIWVIGIRSSEAKSLNLILEPFNIPEGAYVYIYDSSRKIIRGAFTNENNSASGILPTMPVPGEEIIMEYHIPVKNDFDNTLGISQVSHDYAGVFGADDKKDSRYKLSQACNVDINCPDGNNFSIEKRSVCRLIVRGVELCTGVLLNNTNQQNRPLLLTAQHCITDQNDADKSLFVFGYESPWCNGPDGTVSHSVSGSVLRSTNVEIDFSLVELNTFPPIVCKPYLAGWDVSGSVPANTSAIHHPMGDVKKISTDYDSPVTATFNSMPASTSWKIIQWDKGTTEGGSSGSPLFDQNKRIVGILNGGEAVCGRSVNDYFLKMSVAYNRSSLLYQQLKGWIDPAVSGVTQLNGRDPYASNFITSDTLANLLPAETPTFTKYPLTGQGYSTGYNSDSILMYAEYFTNTSAHEISEVWLNIAKANSVTTNDSIRVYIFSDGAVPGSVLASQKIYIREAKDSFRLRLDFNNTIPVTGNFYVGWRIWYVNNALSETRQFALYHSPDRVLAAKNTAWFYKGTSWKPFLQHPFAPMSVSLDVKVIITTNSVVNHSYENKNIANEFLIYPNPANDRIVVSSGTVKSNITLSIMEITGNIIKTSSFANCFPGEITISIPEIMPGYYLIRISSGNSSETHKVLISR
jgi:lysyl endopeptidase